MEDVEALAAGGCCGAIQLVDGDGGFNDEGLQHFMSNTKMADTGVSYAVVAAMGPQSSGKSTLLNHLFSTKFSEMDACRGRNQTTRGIWIAECRVMDTFTIAMDLEGTDSRERGEDDTAFEKQSALFALATANVLLINMWCHDIGREHASNKPLLKTVFEVMMHLFNPRKTTLLFVLRDRTKTPLEHLEPILMEDIQQVWADVAKPDAHTSTPLSEFFNVEFTALSSYEEKEQEFKEQVDQLRLRISNSISLGSLPGDGIGFVPASGFSYSIHQIWKAIKDNKNLDLPAHKVMVAAVRCEEIAMEKFRLLMSNDNWVSLEKAVQTGPISGFGQKVSSILGFYLLKYDEESLYFDKGVRQEKRQLLEFAALDVVYHAYSTMLRYLSSQALESFKTMLDHSLNNGEGFTASVSICKQSCMLEFDEGCEDAAIRQASWDASILREKLCYEIETYVSSVKSSMLSEMLAQHQKQLTDALTRPVESLFELGKKDTWTSMRKLLKNKTEDTVTVFSTAVASFELDSSIIDRMSPSFRKHARYLVEKKAREEVGVVLFRMKDRFTKLFHHDKCSNPRVWTGKEEIVAVTNDARFASLKILSVMAAIRLDKKTDNIEEVLFSSLMNEPVSISSSEGTSTEAARDPLASSMWEEVSPNDTLLTPLQCKSLWKEFIEDTQHEVTHAISAQKAQKWKKRRSSFLWAVAENVGAAAAGTATGIALVAVGIAAGPAGAVGGTVGLMTAAAAAAIK